MSSNVCLVDDDHARAMTLAMRLAATRYPVTIADTALGVLRSATRCAARQPAAIVYAMTGLENVVEMRSLLEASAATRFVLLVPEFPPSAALARIVNAHGGLLLWAEESPLVVASTLVVMLAAAGSVA
jgi:hypothetical protein